MSRAGFEDEKLVMIRLDHLHPPLQIYLGLSRAGFEDDQLFMVGLDP